MKLCINYRVISASLSIFAIIVLYSDILNKLSNPTQSQLFCICFVELLHCFQKCNNSTSKIRKSKYQANFQKYFGAIEKYSQGPQTPSLCKIRQRIKSNCKKDLKEKKQKIKSPSNLVLTKNRYHNRCTAHKMVIHRKYCQEARVRRRSRTFYIRKSVFTLKAVLLAFSIKKSYFLHEYLVTSKLISLDRKFQKND